MLLFLLATIIAGLILAKPLRAEVPQTNEVTIRPPLAVTIPPGWTPKDISTPAKRQTTPKAIKESTAPYAGRIYSKEEVIELIKSYAAQYGISADLPLRVARCESGYRWDAKNRTSSASGVFQYLSGTFANTPEGKQGLSAFDADANIRAAVRHMAVHGTSPWNASKPCWNT